MDISHSTLSTDIDGLYYLRADDPVILNDMGSLLRDAPTEDEATGCTTFVLFQFQEEGNYEDIYTISNIYYHVWQHEPDPWSGPLFYFGYSTSSAHNMDVNESIKVNTDDDCISEVDEYRLVQKMLYTDTEIARFDGKGIYNFTVKSYGNGPVIRNYPDQHSFVILNLEDNQTLLELDRDSDHLNDYDELYVYYTNPFDADTDDDGRSDYEEVVGGIHGYTYSDPNDFTDTTNYELIVYVDAGGPYEGEADEPVQFSGFAEGGALPYQEWFWDFGDGNISYEQNPVHIYDHPGEYEITLTVTDNENTVDFGQTIANIILIGDLNCNGVIDIYDIYVMLNAWGPCDEGFPPDLNNDLTVNIDDLFILLGNWG